MKHYKFLSKSLVLILVMLPFIYGCSKKHIEGYDKVVGTATINGQKYKETIRWAWNYNGKYPSDICLYENYKLFHFLVRLSSEKDNNQMCYIYFYVSENESQIKLKHFYKIDFYKEWNIESLYRSDVIPYISENRSKVFTEGADGIVYVISSIYNEAIPLKGEFIIEEVSSERNICYGSYTLTSSEDNSETVVINGKFETTYYTSNIYF